MISFDSPEAFLLVPPVALLLWLLARKDPDPSRRRRWLTLGIRLAVVSLVAGALADPGRVLSEPLPRRLVVLVDRSDSIHEDSRLAAERLLASIVKSDPAADLEVLAFGGWTRPFDRAAPPETIDVDPTASDLGGALSAALARSPALDSEEGRFDRVVLLSDGNETKGDAVVAARALGRAGVALDVHSLPGPAAPRVSTGPRIVALDAASEGDAGAPLLVRVLVRGTAGGSIELRVRDRIVARTDAPADGGEHIVELPAFELPEGLHQFEARVAGVPASTRARAIRIRPGPRVVAVRSVPEPGPVETALVASENEIRTVSPRELRATLTASGPADVLLLETPGLLDGIVASLPELVGAMRRGASVLVTGGIDLAAASRTPLLDFLPILPEEPPPAPPDPPQPEAEPEPGVRLDVAEKDAVRVALLLVIDTSGSMRGLKIAMAQRAAMEATMTLDPEDTLGILGFADSPYWIVRPTAAGNRRAIAQAVAGLVANGGTDIYQALREGIRAMKRVKAGVRHVILLSDGHTPTAPFREIILDGVQAKVTLTTVGIGSDFDPRLMVNLADWGRGEFRYASRPSEIPRIVTGDTKRVLPEGRGESSGPAPVPPDPGPRPEPGPGPDEAPTPAEERPRDLRIASPHPALRGIPEPGIPPLVAVPARARAAAWVALTTEPEAPENERRPVLAEWRVGLGRVLVLSSDLERGGWRDWPDAPKLWTQAVRALAAASGPASGPTLTVGWTADAARLRALVAPGDGPVTFRVGEGEERREIAATEVGGGSFEALIARDDEDRTVLVEALASRAGARALVVEIPAIPRPEEVGSGTNRPLLERIADAAEGRLDPDPGDVPPSPNRSRREPLAVWLLVAAAALLPIDVGVRRLRFFLTRADGL